MKKGFTLIELLVVIFIIGLLASIVVVSVNTARMKSRDARRIADMDSVRGALEMYADANSSYPSTGNGWGATSVANPSSWIPTTGFVPQFLSFLPRDPRNTGNYYYQYRSDGQNYKVMANTMEGSEGLARANSDGGTRPGAYELFTPDAQSW